VRDYYGSGYDDLRLEFESIVMDWVHVTRKYMFGSHAYLVRGRLFAFLVEDGVIITSLSASSRERLTELLEAFPFESKGKPVGGWMRAIVNDDSDLETIMPYVRESYEASLAKA
jgi:hypothetical protein